MRKLCPRNGPDLLHIRKPYMFTHFPFFYQLLTLSLPCLLPRGSTALWACAQKEQSPQHFSFLIPTITHCSLLVRSVYYKSAHRVHIFSPPPSPLLFPLFLLPLPAHTEFPVCICGYLSCVYYGRMSQASWMGPLLGITSHPVGPSPSSPTQARSRCSVFSNSTSP